MDEGAFFIGWLPIPLSYRRLLIPLAVALLIGAATVSAALAFFQRQPGSGRWESETVTFDGLAFARPYALLRVPGNEPQTILLVEEGKFGAADRVAQLEDGQGVAVRVTGTLIQRDGRRMLELLPGDEGMRRLGSEEETRLRKLGWPAPVAEQEATLRGEIIDPKCYLGAMRPGGGKTHKACAMLCVRGGVPPMLVTRDGDGRETFYILTTAEGGAANDLALPFVGDAVEVTGQVRREGDLLFLRTPDGGVRRR